MAEYQQKTSEQISRPAPASRSTQPAPRKLRDSCHGCAASKVKCNQVKPACARCINRGMPCEYVPTKRAGRKRDSRTSDAAKMSKPSPTSNSPMTSGLSQSTSPSRIQLSPTHRVHSYPGMISEIQPFEETPSSTLLNAGTGFDDFFSTLMPFPSLDTPDDGILQGFPTVSDGGFSESNNVPSLHMPDSAYSIHDEDVPQYSNLFKPLTPPESRASVTSDAQSYQNFQAFQGFQGSGSESSCCCLIRALAIMKQLFSNSSRKPSYQQLPVVQDIIAENEQALQATTQMLECACSQEDGYLLSIVSLVASKVLSRYATATHEVPNPASSQRMSESPYEIERYSPYHSEDGLQLSKVMSSYSIDGEDQDRIAAQLVLGELHRVQRLINLFSKRMKEYSACNVMKKSPDDASDVQEASSNSENASPFSAARLDIIEADLRKHLRALSLEIVDKLRRG